jgi:TRAP-type mannitol/chloroaromatic compound transport system permease small subunit
MGETNGEKTNKLAFFHVILSPGISGYETTQKFILFSASKVQTAFRNADFRYAFLLCIKYALCFNIHISSNIPVSSLFHKMWRETEN